MMAAEKRKRRDEDRKASILIIRALDLRTAPFPEARLPITEAVARSEQKRATPNR
jgi:hypothetical protein